MKRIMAFVLALSLILLCGGLISCENTPDDPDNPEGETTVKDERTPAELAGNVIYVATDGSDTDGDGTEAKPYATIPGARDAIRKIKENGGLPDGGITVLLAGGTYRITEPIELTAEDSGEAGKTITYKAKDGADVIIDGGFELNGSDFRPANEAFLAKLQTADAKANVLEIDLKEAGVPNLEDRRTYGWGGEALRGYKPELFVENERQIIARWPNDDNAVSNVLSAEPQESSSSRINKLEIPDGKAAAWNGEYFYFCGMLWNGWDTITMSGEETVYTDPEDNTLVIVDQMPFYTTNSGRQFYVFNLPAELDAPGEYYWDTEDNMLYYYPKEDLSGKKISFSQVEGELIHCTTTSYLTFDGLTIENGCGCGITVERETGDPFSDHITIQNCLFRCLGGMGLDLNEVTNVLVDRNEIVNMGCGGIYIGNLNRAVRTPLNNVLTNNRIHNFGQIFPTEQMGIRANGIGYHIAHNEIYDGKHSAMDCHVADSIIEYNLCHDLCSMSGDAGAIYNGGTWALPGNLFRYNYIYNVIFNYDGLHPNGIYLDDMLQCQFVYGNIVRNTGGRGITTGGGKQLTICNNILIDNGGSSIFLNDNGISFEVESNRYHPEKSGYWAELEAMGYQSTYISSVYPELNLLAEVGYSSRDLDDPGTPSYNIVQNNIRYGELKDPVTLTDPEDVYVAPYETFNCDGVVAAGGLSYRYGSIRNNLVYMQDPGFTTIGKVADALSDDSQVYRDLYQFTRIPFEKIGIED